MSTRLSKHQLLRLFEKLNELTQAGTARHTGLLGSGKPTWGDGEVVFGTRDDLSASGVKRACAVCGETTYTSIRYPDDVPILCEICAYGRLVEKDEA